MLEQEVTACSVVDTSSMGGEDTFVHAVKASEIKQIESEWRGMSVRSRAVAQGATFLSRAVHVGWPDRQQWSTRATSRIASTRPWPARLLIVAFEIGSSLDSSALRSSIDRGARSGLAHASRFGGSGMNRDTRAWYAR